eukprot:snap_masked-scaffold_1-processed-gene-20.21-mRNA-1 protein AED:1.00 eAED:1.00 QI:0/-1/0/0/-1/1/1/0/1001
MTLSSYYTQKRFEATSFIVRRPCLCYWGAWMFLLVIAGVAGSSGWFETVDFTGYDFDIPDSSASKDEDAYDLAVQASDSSQLPQPFRSQPVFLTLVSIIYEWSDDAEEEDIFTAENIRDICLFESIYLGTEDFRKFCITGDAQGAQTVCSPQILSMVSLNFYSLDSFQSEETRCPLLEDGEVLDIRDSMLNSSSTLSFFDRSVTAVDIVDAVSPRTKSAFIAGGPLGSDTTGDENLEFNRIPSTSADSLGKQVEIYGEYLSSLRSAMEEYTTFQSSFFRSGYFGDLKFGADNQLKVRYINAQFEGDELGAIVGADLTLLGFAILLVGGFIFLHIGSIFITVSTLVSVLMSIPLGLFLQIGVIRLEYFTVISFTAMFLILGIGVDNIFIFFDQLEQAKLLVQPNEEEKQDLNKEDPPVAPGKTLSASDTLFAKRLDHALGQAAESVFVTTLTTAGAFFAASFYPLAPIAEFAIYAGLVVVANFLMLFLVYPSTAVIHEQYTKSKFCCCINKNYIADVCENALVSEAQLKENEDQSEVVEVDTWESRFVNNMYLPLMQQKLAPWFSIGFQIILLAIFLGSASQLEVPTQVEGNFSPGHMFRNIRDDSSKLFAGAAEEEFLDFQYTFGIKGIDRDGFSRWEPNGYRGTPVFDEQFSIVSSEAQEHILFVCDALRNLVCIKEGEYEPLVSCQFPNSDLAVVPGSVDCVLEDFYVFFQQENNIPTIEDAIEQAMELGDNDPFAFTTLLQSFVSSGRVNDVLGFFDGRLGFLTLKYKATLKVDRPVSEVNPYLDFIFAFEDEVRSLAPLQLKTTFQTSQARQDAVTSEAIIEGLFQGMIIAFSIAIVALVVTTDNYILGSFAFLTIAIIVCSILGTVQLVGWTLGQYEAIAIIVSIGLSVDYSVHLSVQYNSAGAEGKETREERFEFAASRMGPSVITGFVTTAAAISVLLASQAAFFARLGALIIMTVIYSIAASFFFFLPMTKVLGPQGNSGKISLLLAKLFKKQ